MICRESIKRWCSTDKEEKYVGIGSPWTVGEWTYATNRAAIVRASCRDVGSFSVRELVPSQPDKFIDPPVTASRLWGKIDLPQPEFSIDCERCSGTGKLTCDLGHKHRCPGCGGRKTITYANGVVMLSGLWFAEPMIALAREVFGDSSTAEMQVDWIGRVAFFRDGSTAAAIMALADTE